MPRRTGLRSPGGHRVPQQTALRTPDNILLVNHPLALAVKVSLPRPLVQGELRDTDCYAGQQYAPLMDMEVAPDDQPPGGNTAMDGRGHPR
ncbi:DUF4387 family protein [Streptomyces atroolivaceus]|uniref:DUF4387 family protein n=1 Tax=Streptomyces atroolivaceus TaxID=66869 RepID=UPI0032AF157F